MKNEDLAIFSLETVRKYSLALISVVLFASLFLTNLARAQEMPNVRIPTPVRNVVITKMDGLYRTFTIQWMPNPAGEHVDSYAVYSKDGLRPNISRGVLIGITKRDFLALNSWVPVESPQPPHTVKIVLGTDSEFWVLAHNSHGWGENAFQTPLPGKAIPVKLLDAEKLKYFPHIFYQPWSCTKIVKSHYGSAGCV